LDVLTPEQINPSQKKEERLNALCNFLNQEKFDVVFLQELWYKKDHDFVAECTKQNYHCSKYDEVSCEAANGVSCNTVISPQTLRGGKHFCVRWPIKFFWGPSGHTFVRPRT